MHVLLHRNQFKIMQTVKIKKLNEAAVIPVWNNKSAGCDLSSTEFYILKPGERKLFKTGLSIAIPSGLYGRIAPRSGLAYKSGIDVLAGVIDEDYRGEVGVILINLGQEDKNILVGDKIAQLIFEHYNRCGFEVVDNLDDTNRGTGGYGSTDSKKTSQELSEMFKQVQHEKKVAREFKLGPKTNIPNIPSRFQAEASFKLARHDGEIYAFTENDRFGICVVDSSGQVLDKLFFS
jgi:dUTP pyrophosphatase